MAYSLISADESRSSGEGSSKSAGKRSASRPPMLAVTKHSFGGWNDSQRSLGMSLLSSEEDASLAARGVIAAGGIELFRQVLAVKIIERHYRRQSTLVAPQHLHDSKLPDGSMRLPPDWGELCFVGRSSTRFAY